MSDARTIETTDVDVGVIWKENIRYCYVLGKLNSISWENEEVLFTVSVGGLSLHEYPLEKADTFLSHLLNPETVIEAVNTFNEALK